MSTTNETAPDPCVYRVGPSGWSYADWKGIVYPQSPGRRFDPLRFLSGYFDAIEVNVSFYRAVTERMAASWVRRVADRERFRFVFKLHQSFTHERTEYSTAAVARFLAGLEPVARASRLGCILMQFPWSFRRSRSAIEWLKRLAGDFGACPLVVELRHDSWAIPETYETLARLGAGYCNIDQPPLPHCLGPSSVATSDVGYVRLHGRRSDTWFAPQAPSFERYNYLYSVEELKEWIPRIKRLGQRSREVYVFSNNHYRGQGPANALQLCAMLAGGPVEVPPALVEHFPELRAIRRAESTSFPGTLF